MSYYAVANGRNVGVYRSWSECEQQVKGFPQARFKKFASDDQANKFISDYMQSIGSSVTRRVVSSAIATSAQLSTRITSSLQRSLSESSGRKRDASPTSRRPGPKRSKTESSISSGPLLPPLNLPTSNHFSTIPRPVEVFTDGSCLSNGRKKGARAGLGVYWGDEHPLNIAEHLPPSAGPPTNNRAEILACCRALEVAHQQGIEHLKICTDSNFTIQCITQWMTKWKKNGWKRGDGGAVVNRAELELLDSLTDGINVEWCHVRSHIGIKGNEEADRLANMGAI